MSSIDDFFSDHLIRYLIINFSLLSVLLSASILVVSSAGLIRISIGGHGESFSPPELVATTRDLDRNTETNSNLRSLHRQPKVMPSTSTSAIGSDSPSGTGIQPASKAKFSVTASSSMPNVRPLVSSFIASLQNAAHQWALPTDRSDDQTEKESEVLLVTALSPEDNRQNPETGDRNRSLGSIDGVCTVDSQIACDQPADPITAPFYGTRIQWHRQAEEAAKLAQTENRLLYVIHVSGNFTKEEFT